MYLQFIKFSTWKIVGRLCKKNASSVIEFGDIEKVLELIPETVSRILKESRIEVKIGLRKIWARKKLLAKF